MMREIVGFSVIIVNKKGNFVFGGKFFIFNEESKFIFKERENVNKYLIMYFFSSGILGL